jgi:hypothetical protein
MKNTKNLKICVHITINNKEIELSYEEAEQLYKDLAVVFEKGKNPVYRTPEFSRKREIPDNDDDWPTIRPLIPSHPFPKPYRWIGDPIPSERPTIICGKVKLTGV